MSSYKRMLTPALWHHSLVCYHMDKGVLAIASLPVDCELLNSSQTNKPAVKALQPACASSITF